MRQNQVEVIDLEFENGEDAFKIENAALTGEQLQQINKGIMELKKEVEELERVKAKINKDLE